VRTLGFLPDTVLVDPEYLMLSKNNTTLKATPVNGTPGVDVFPNPVTDPVTVYLHDISHPSATLRLINAIGQVLYKKDIALINGAEIYQLNMGHLPKGLYILSITAGDFNFNKQLVK
jgi:hypothetical protein